MVGPIVKRNFEGSRPLPFSDSFLPVPPPAGNSSFSILPKLTPLEKLATRAGFLTAIRFVSEIFSLRKYWNEYNGSFTNTDLETRRFSVWNMSISVLDITDASMQFLLVIEGVFRVGLSTAVLAFFVVPVGGVLLLLRSAMDIYHLVQSHKMQETLNNLYQKTYDIKQAPHAIESFFSSRTTNYPVESEKLDEGEKALTNNSTELLQRKHFLVLERGTSANIAAQFERLARAWKQGSLQTKQLQKVLQNAKILHWRKSVLKICLVAFSALAIVSFGCAFSQPVVVGLSLISFAFLGRMLLSLFSACFLELNLTLEEM